MRTLTAAILVATWLVGCDDGAGLLDGGVDGGQGRKDGGGDGGADAGPDLGTDAEPARDAGGDAGADAAERDAAAGDAAGDAGPEPDGAVPPFDFPPDPAAAPLAALAARSQAPLLVEMAGGLPRVVGMDVPAPPGDQGEPLPRALAFLAEHGDFYRLDDPLRQLYLSRQASGPDGTRHVWLGQRIDNTPVVGAEIAVHFRGDRVVGTTGGWIGGPPRRPAVTITADEAVARALDDAGAGAQAVGRPRLVWYDRSLFTGGAPDPRLCWQVGVFAGAEQGAVPTPWLALVDVRDGAIAGRLAGAHEGGDDRNLAIHDAMNRTNSACWYFEGAPIIWKHDGRRAGFPAGDPDAETAEVALPAVYDYYLDRHGRASWGGAHNGVALYIHVGVAWANARWINYPCRIMEFGDGNVTADIVGHEFTHGVIEHTSGLVYQGESGALNESYADIFGAMQDGNWLIGEGSAFAPCAGLPAGTIRSMSNPPDCGDPDHVDPARSGDGIGMRDTSSEIDRGFVHVNSSITNKAAWLLTEGGRHDGLDVRGIGRAKTEPLLYEVMARRLVGSSRLRDAAATTLVVAREWADERRHGFTADDVCQVRNAYAAVGLGERDSDCDGTLDPDDADRDGDFVPNSRDNCPDVANPSQSDIDGDGIGDSCDDDIDGDGRLNGNDNCPFISNPTQLDFDFDGIGDPCDDEDRDGVPDHLDNCPRAFNPGQEDLDRDTRGDVCDNDVDGDGVADALDSCPRQRNLGRDTDRDGVDDVCDNCREVANPSQSDLDGDGIGDACDDDRDGDGRPNGQDPCPDDFEPEPAIDLDGDGRTLACDDDELSTVGGDEGPPRYGRLPLPGVDRLVRVPISPCLAGGCPDWLPAGLRFGVLLDAPAGTAARIVDSDGRVVAFPAAGPPLQFGPGLVMTFAPDADHHYRGPGADPDRPVLSARSYFLEVRAPAQHQGDLFVGINAAMLP